MTIWLSMSIWAVVLVDLVILSLILLSLMRYLNSEHESSDGAVDFPTMRRNYMIPSRYFRRIAWLKFTTIVVVGILASILLFWGQDLSLIIRFSLFTILLIHWWTFLRSYRYVNDYELIHGDQQDMDKPTSSQK